MRDDEKESLALAVQATLERLEDDQARVSPEVADLLRQLHSQLSITELGPGEATTPPRRPTGLARILENCSRNLLAVFAAEVGLPVARYFMGARLETAARLLRDTELSANRVGSLVGFNEPAGFRAAFRRWFGMRPLQLRRAARRLSARVPRPEDEILSFGFWQKVDRGELQPAEEGRLILWFRRVAEGGDGGAGDGGIANPEGQRLRERSAQRMAEVIWQTLTARSAAAQHYLLRHEIRTGSPALFELLSRKSREEGRRDRQRLAELALACVEGSAESLGSGFRSLHVLALARLGQAHRLASDFAAAEEAFARAAGEWETPGAHHDPRAEAELCLYQGSLRLFQRRYEASVGLLSRSLLLSEELGDVQLRVTSLLQRAAALGHQGRPEQAIPDLHLTSCLAEQLGDPELAVFAQHDLTKAYVDTGDYGQAEHSLERAKELYRELDEALRRHQLRWIEGQLRLRQGDAAAAEQRWREAREGFLELGELDYAGEISLELAVLCHQQGRSAEVVDLVVSTVIPVFERLRVQREAVGALRLLREAVAAHQVTLALLDEARLCLRSLLRDAQSAPTELAENKEPV